MKILIVAPSRKMGGIERALSVLANEWAQQNFEVVYVCCLKSEAFYPLHPNIKVVEPEFKRVGGFFNKLFFYPKLVHYLRVQIKEQQPDRVLSFGDFFNPLVLLAAKGINVPVYISDRTSADFKFPSYIKFLKQWLYPESAGFIAQTQRAFDAKKTQFGSSFRQTIIPNAIRAVEKLPLDREKIIAYAGRFSWEKNPVALIEAFQLMENKQDWKLVMAGDGPQLEEMKKKVQIAGIEHQVDFLGSVSNLDLWLNKSSIFVLPSVLEGFPNALCEAMSAGLPVVCFDSIAYESIIKPGINGRVIPFGKVDLLAACLSELSIDSKQRLYLGNNASEKSKEWNVKVIVNQYAQFLKLYE
jgi:glycosyltransferase involved in cell wall biosynthesis